LGTMTILPTTFPLDSGSDNASSRGIAGTQKTVVKLTSIFLQTEFLLREHFNNYTFVSR
jgi:hypothetical protein